VRQLIKDLVVLTKPRIVILALITTMVGFYLGTEGAFQWGTCFWLLAGAGLLGGGVNTFNQVMEIQQDGIMKRTMGRPLPAGRLGENTAWLWGMLLCLTGLGLLGLGTSFLATFLGVGILVSYLLFYTPLKKITHHCTLVGAIPGALPPALGWVASHGTFDIGGWVLFAFLFIWQLPHFYALSWVYRDDYERAGFRMVSVIDLDGKLTARHIAIYSIILVPISILPVFVGLAGAIYLSAALLLGILLAGFGIAVGIDPPFISRAEGCFLWDVEENRYIDYVGSWGPMILGHSHPEVVKAIEKRADGQKEEFVF